MTKHLELIEALKVKYSTSLIHSIHLEWLTNKLEKYLIDDYKTPTMITPVFSTNNNYSATTYELLWDIGDDTIKLFIDFNTKLGEWLLSSPKNLYNENYNLEIELESTWKWINSRLETYYQHIEHNLEDNEEGENTD